MAHASSQCYTVGMTTYCQHYDMSIGMVCIAETQGCITHVHSVKDIDDPEGCHRQETPLLTEAAQQLQAYFQGKRKAFDLPLRPSGTPFQLNVWDALCTIPYGTTWSYQELAIAIGNPKATRAVGMANHNNPISFIIPCHRVIGKHGQMVGYGGGIELKKWLLDLEKTHLLRDFSQAVEH